MPAEAKLLQVKGQLALLADHVQQQMGTIEFRERCISHERKETTSIRYAVWELEQRKRALLTEIGHLRSQMSRL